MALDKKSQNEVCELFGHLFPGAEIKVVGNHHVYGCDEITVYPPRLMGNTDLKKILEVSNKIGNSVCVGSDAKGAFLCYF